jgi:hypothetical protein
MEDNAQRYYSSDEAAAYLTNCGLPIKKQTLAKYRVTGEGPEFRKFGSRVLYHPRGLDAWKELKLTKPRRSTSELAA